MINHLLFLLSRQKLDPKNLPEINQALTAGFDWDLFFSRAVSEGVCGLIYRHLKAYSDTVPQPVLNRFQIEFLKTAAKNVSNYERLKPVIQALEEASVRYVIIKGARLAKTVYGNMAFRPFADVDIIVEQEDLPVAEDLLTELGFQTDGDADGRIGLGAKNRFFWLYRPLFQKRNLFLEIHFNFPGLSFALSADHHAWEHTRVFRLDDVKAKMFSPEVELCLLALHVQQHSYSRLIWMTDIAETVSQKGFNWETVHDFCEKEHIQTSVSYSLFLVNSFWPGTVDRDVLDRMKVTYFKKKILHYLWPEKKVLARAQQDAYPMHLPTAFSLRGGKDIFRSLKILFKIFFPPAEWVSYYYRIPKKTWPMFRHYMWRLVRPFELLVKRTLRKG